MTASPSAVSQARSRSPWGGVEHYGFQIPRDLAWRTGRLEHFREVSDQHLSLLAAHAGLASARDVVEIGCGCGRDAIPLIDILPTGGSYLGIDIMAPSIAWAQRAITGRDERFEFVHFDVADMQHNPDGGDTMQDHRIPRDDGTADLVFLFSVFTHMFPADVAWYLDEFARVLRPGGRVLASVFRLEEAERAHLDRIGGGGLRALTFRHEVQPGFFHNDPMVVPGATAYSGARLQEMADTAGLETETWLRGSWRRDGVHDVSGQDILVLRRPG